jgi:16S rRNA (guanine527-N7)-methyltransferase
MKDYNTLLFDETKKNGMELSDKQIAQFNLYYELLTAKNKVMNLTAITEYNDVVKKHFIDSMMISRVLDMKKINSLCDVGTGAGFPGIPLKIVYPHLHLTLVDSVGKRVNFLSEVVEKLDLEDVEAIHSRTEDLAHNSKYREKYDLVTARAVASMNVLSEYCIPYAKIGGYFAAYKSGNIEEEIENAKNAVKTLGGKIEKTDMFELYEMGRSIVLIRKVNSTPKIYPRKAGTPSKNPL